jgi:hypothetical protein
MYKVYCDNLLLYHSKLENLKIFDPSVELELNKTGSFEFTVHTDHPYYNFIKKLKSIITVFQDDFLLFRGRVLDDEIGWHNEKHITCEGELAFLLDSIQRPVSFTGTAAEFLAHIINSHNSQVEPEKRFTLGSVTVAGSLTVDLTEYTNSFETLQKWLLDGFGGYLKTRQKDGINYLDYLAEITLLAPQSIQFGKNLLDLKRIRKGADIATAVIPLGKDGLTIASVNHGLDYIVDEDAKAQFGFIVKMVSFTDIDDATKLMAAGQAQLSDFVNQWESVELSAADLATVDKTVTSFHLGTQVRVTSNPHGLNQLFTVSKLSISLLDPASNKLVLGKTISTFSESVVFQKGDPGKPGSQGLPGKDGVNGKDGANGKDGKDGVGVASITEQYYLSTSATALAGGTWSGTVPTWVDGRFMWTRSVITYTNSTVVNTNPKCVTGAKGSTGSAGSPGAAGKDGISITKVDVMYYQSTSATALSGGSWLTDAPAWVNGRFFWEKTVVTYSDGTTAESKPVCITGQQGQTGATGSAGAKGDKGDKGDTGSPGANGKDGKDAAVQSLTAPSDTSFLWLDIGLDPPLLKRYDPEAAAWVVVNDTTAVVYNLEQNFISDILQTEQNIQMMVAETVYLKDQTDAIVSEVESKLEQTASGFEMQFNQFSADIEAVAAGTDAEFEEIKKYIRFVDGKILLGEVGNELELEIANDRISFLQEGAEVAYFSNRKLYVTDADIIHSLQLGSFAFMPRANGNISFKKVGG